MAREVRSIRHETAHFEPFAVGVHCGQSRREREAGGADLIIAPPLPYITGFNTDYRKMAIATGEAAARAALPQIRALVSR